MIKYHNAINAEGNLVDIDRVTPENRALMQFFCLGCGTEMEAVLGKRREHHFRHKSKDNCDPETYLHRLAKRVLKYKFDTQTKFLVTFYAKNDCHKFSQCEFRERHNWQDCSSVIPKTFNMKEYYNTCEEESSYKGFRADIMLSHSEHTERHPVFFEVSVTHDCTQDKIDSGIRIIEIKVKNEYDAFGSVMENEGELVPEDKITMYYRNSTPQRSPIKFYNFKRTYLPTHSFSRFSLIRDDKGIYRTLFSSKAVTCHNANYEHEKNACFEVIVSEGKITRKQNGNLYALGMALACKRGLHVKICIFCERYGKCVIYQDFWAKQPQNPEPILVRKSCAVRRLSIQDLEILPLAPNCSRYLPYGYAIQRAIDLFKFIPYWEWIKTE